MSYRDVAIALVKQGAADALIGPNAMPYQTLLQQAYANQRAAQMKHDIAPWYSRWIRSVGSFRSDEGKKIQEEAINRANKLYDLVGKGSPDRENARAQADMLRRAAGLQTDDEILAQRAESALAALGE